MEHLVIKLSPKDWKKYKTLQEDTESSIYSDNTNPFFNVHYVYGDDSIEWMDEVTFQKFQNKLFNF